MERNENGNGTECKWRYMPFAPHPMCRHPSACRVVVSGRGADIHTDIHADVYADVPTPHGEEGGGREDPTCRRLMVMRGVRVVSSCRVVGSRCRRADASW